MAIDRTEKKGLIFVSAISLIELVYLTEKGRIPREVPDLLRLALDDSSTAFRLAEVGREICGAIADISRETVPDMPDRIIAATALQLNLPLVTKDKNVRSLQNVTTIW